MTLTRAAAAVVGIALLILALAGPAYRAGLALQTALAMLRWAGYIGAAGVVLAIAVGALAYRRRQRLPFGLAIGIGVAGLVAVGVPWLWQRRAERLPPIHDISTDLENPPAFEAIVPLRGDGASPLDRPPMLAAQQRDGYPDIAPRTLALPVDRAFNRALDLAERQGWTVVASNPERGIIEATDTTFWFGFTEDVVVRVMPWGSGTRVDMRSVSRVGRSDAGSNARRIRGFLDELEEQ